jgi:hypothetical protein
MSTNCPCLAPIPYVRPSGTVICATCAGSIVPRPVPVDRP